ncbi:MAG: hypothetical protein M5U09_01305 [Gammaproteobacteria bacterium]|nr:hypothetical protein [Gammaproteobacteria bacterium]
MPAEVGMLLPANDGPTARWIDSSSGPDKSSTWSQDCSSPVRSSICASRPPRLAAAGCRWVANLPSVDLHDPEFTAQVADVGLDRDREIAALAAFRERGFAIAAVAVDEAGARAAAAIEPDAVIVMPRVGDFAAGFPSLRQRQSAVQAVARTLAASDWRGRLLGLGESRDVESRELWPQGARRAGLPAAPLVATNAVVSPTGRTCTSCCKASCARCRGTRRCGYG